MNKKGNMEGGETMQIFPETGRMMTKIFTILLEGLNSQFKFESGMTDEIYENSY